MQLTQPTNVDGKLWLPGIGNPNSRLMIIGSHPNQEDAKRHQIFHPDGEIAQELYTALEVNQIDASHVYFTTMVKYGIGTKPKPTSAEIAECAPYLEEEINEVKPDLIIALGAESFKRVMKTNMKVSDYLGEIIDCPYGKVLANHSPGTVVAQDPTKRPEFQEIFHLAYRYLTGNLKYQEFDYLVVDDVDTGKEIVDHYIRNEMFYVGYDGEWKGKNYLDQVLHTMQFSCEPHKAIILDLSKDSKTENLELLHTMKPLMEHPEVKRMGWNIRADDKALVHRGFNLTDESLYMDGMKAMAFFDSRFPKGLETGIRRFTNYPPYYNSFHLELRAHKIPKENMCDLKFINPELFYRYCGGDAVSHREACMNIHKNFPEHLRDFFFGTYLPLSNYILEMEMTGIPVDIPLMTDITKKYQDKYKELAISLTQKLEAIGVKDFNFNSPPQKKELFFKKLGLPPVYYTKAGKSAKPRAWYERQKPHVQKQYSPSTNGKTISTLAFELKEKIDQVEGPLKENLETSYDIIKNFLSLNRIGVFANKFLSLKGVDIEGSDDEFDEDEVPLKQSYWAALTEDNRIHADFFECLQNLRSSSRPNCQVAPSKALSHVPDIFVPGFATLAKEEKKRLEKEVIPSNIRHVFCSGDPAWRWVEGDVASADLQIAAYLSGDLEYTNDLLQGGFHLKKAREYFSDPTITKDDYSRYVSAKSISFRVAYTSDLMSAAAPIQSEIFAESGNYIPLETVQYALSTWNRYTKYMEYREACNQMVLNHNYTENARGIRLTYDHTENFGIRSGWLNQSLSHPISTSLACFVWDVSVSIRKQLKKDGVWMKHVFPVNCVHDALYFLVKKELISDNYFPEIMKNFFTKECKIETGDVLGLDMSVGMRWKDKNPELTKETKWNFENKCWDWKE